MKKHKLTYFLSFLLLGSIGVALFYHAKVTSLKKELLSSKALQHEFDSRMEIQHELLHIDSMLVDGQYKEALKAYSDQFKELKDQEENGIQLRMVLAQNLLKNSRKVKEDSAKNAELEADSTQVEALTATEINALDSLSFILEKTRVQLARIKRQAQNKGAYLTFKSSKGTKMYYVGQVKNKKANGQGIALLASGSRYEGEWKDNMRHGQGMFYWADGQHYEGSYVNDKREGEGTYYWPNGEKYVGEWKNDQRFGRGVFYGKQGDIVANGVWKEDVLVQNDK